MDVLPPNPQYHLYPVKCPVTPIHKIDDLNERQAARASVEWEGFQSNKPYPLAAQQNMIKLIMARYSQVEPVYYGTIIGGPRVPTTVSDERMIKRVAETTTTSWFGISSWVQKYIEGEMVWHDYQAKLNKINRTIKLLKLVPANETQQHRTDRLAFRREYKKSLRIHQDHIRLGAVAQLAEAEEAVESASRKPDFSAIALQALKDQVRSLHQYQDGLVPINDHVIARVDDDDDATIKFYAELNSEEVYAFWEQRWDDNVFISFLWQFQGVLHFK